MTTLDRIRDTIQEYKASGNRRLIDSSAFNDAVSGYCHSIVKRGYPDFSPDVRQEITGRITYTVLSRTLKGSFFNVESLSSYVRASVRNQARRHLGERYDEEDLLLLDVFSDQDVETVQSSKPFLNALEITSFLTFARGELRALDWWLRGNPFTRSSKNHCHYKIIVLYTAVYGADSKSYGLGARERWIISLLSKRLASRISSRFGGLS